MKNNNVLRKSFIVGTLSLMLVNTSLPSNVNASKEAVKDFQLIKLGDQDQAIIELKEYLKILGYSLDDEEEGLFTQELADTIKEIQIENELHATGELDEETITLVLEKIESIDEELDRDEEEENPITNQEIEKEVNETLKSNQIESETEKSSMRVQTMSLSFETVVLEKGMRHEKVKTLKADLDKLGFTVPGKGTNFYGEQTEAKVREFQKYYGLSIDGKAGPATFDKIANILKTPLQKGKRHKDTQKLKANLKTLGFAVPGSGTTLYGSQTEAKVKEFQRAYKLVENGIADEVTLKKINELIFEKENPSVLEKGMRHEKVKTLKTNLKKLGFTVPGKGTNYYGEQTEAKVKEFQKYFSLPVTGKVDSVTDNKITNILKTPLQKGKRHKDTQKLKADLKTLGFAVPGSGTTLYGSQTEAKVKEFQRAYKLVENGIADEVTLKKINELILEKEDPSVLEKGMRHEKVKALKADLKKLGFAVPGKGTNYYGEQTEAKVREFQKYYGLSADGKAGPATFDKITSILKTPLQKGKRHKDTQKLKADLKTLGFAVPGSGTTLYGSQTEAKVKEFQRAYKLVENGIADEVTLRKIAELLKIENEKPKETTTYTNYGITLNQALDIQLHPDRLQLTDKYRNEPAYVSGKYLEFIGTGIITGSSVNVRTEPNLNSSSIAYSLNSGDKVKIVSTVEGTSFSNSTLWYKIENDKKNYYVHSSLLTGTRAKVVNTNNLNVRAGTNTATHIYGKLKRNTTVTIKNPVGSWYSIVYNTWRNATRSDLQQYLDPNNNDKFQHLRLDKLAGATASQLNSVLPQDQRNVLYQTGGSFVKGARDSGINEAYLVSHALLETGNGTSTLAKGVEVGKNAKGELVLVTNNNRNSLTSIKTTYNMFGIGAADSDPLRLGAIRAYKEGWFTPAAAIEGGAKWVGTSYIYNQYNQNTLYKMRWNPQMANGAAWKQYASDIGWATKQVTRIKQIYEKIDNPNMHYDIPKYN